MSPPSSPPADTISKSDFHALLAAYPALIDAMSQTKTTQKPGQKTLKDLDTYRYDKAPLLFGKQHQEMTLADVQHLVEWKLRHGKFRPTLMSLVSSNPPSPTKKTISSALQLYRANPSTNTQDALNALSQLKGVGPATASLLLSVHDPENVIFFSDEAYRWLCRGGNDTPIRYTAREYAELRQRAAELARRLGVGMVDVEKAAYVVVKGDRETAKSTADKAPRGARRDEVSRVAKEAGPKRKKSVKVVDETSTTGLRRSKRHRA